MSKRGLAKTAVGIVTSDKMQKTIAVKVVRLVRHIQFGKYIRKNSIFKAHDEKCEAKEGDKVEIMATRPLSKTKSWRLVKVIKKAD